MKNFPFPLEDNRSTKKTKFRSEGDDRDNPQPMSFKDKLMEDQLLVEKDLAGTDDDLDFDSGNVVVEMAGSIPSISFSQKVHA